jgi:hypothetical protein
MLGLSVGRVESLFDLGLPVEVRELPDDLAALDELLGDGALLEPIAAAWDAAAREFGRPTVPMDRHVRLMVIAAHGLGLRDAGRGGLRLAAPAVLLFDRAVRARPGRVDDPQAHPPPGARRGGEDHPRGDRQGHARAAVRRARGADRLDRCRGRHPQRRHTTSALHPGATAPNHPRRATPLPLAANASVRTCTEFTPAADEIRSSARAVLGLSFAQAKRKPARRPSGRLVVVRSGRVGHRGRDARSSSIISGASLTGVTAAATAVVAERTGSSGH